ncbi:MAG TPA: FG-GAP-like repeat-containing protein [Chryseolinea sp.]
MKRTWTVLCFLLMVAMTGTAQQFAKQTDIALPDSIATASTQWVDLDNDGVLDILLLTKSQAGRSYLQFVKGDTVNTPVLSVQKTRTVEVSAFVVADYDRDNRMDVVVSGVKNAARVTAVYVNQGGFVFAEQGISIRPFTILKRGDLNNDGREEWIASGEPWTWDYPTTIYGQRDDLSFTVYDSLNIKATALELFDAEGDGDTDLFVSGSVKSDSLFTGFLKNEAGFYFKRYLGSSRQGTTSSIGDVNGDGLFDVWVAGKDKNGTLFANLYQSDKGSYTTVSLPITLNNAQLFVADFNSNGVADVQYRGTTAEGDAVNIIEYAAGDYDTLESVNLIQQSAGDLEHDGDLDMVQLVQETALHVVVYKNTEAQKNKAPGVPVKALALPVFGRTFLYWDKPGDDHTPQASLTFDVFLNGAQGYLAGSFDLLNEKRLVSAHGNNGANNFKLLKGIPAGAFNFSVQAVDNALHGGALCIGGRTPCAEATTEELSLCKNEQASLSAPAETLWFSFADGFLGQASTWTIDGAKVDTVFSYSPARGGCAALKTYTWNVKNDTIKTERLQRYVCKDAPLTFTTEPGWQTITWKSDVSGALGSTPTIHYTATQPDTVSVTLTNDVGCTIIRKTGVGISVPDVKVTPEEVKILKGSSVQLIATGAASYSWTPTTGLVDANLSGPVVSPTVTTRYTVTGYDSLGCQGTAHANVIVEGGGFIPNLFTPNEDGKNDELKVYGLTSAQGFSFSIYNREGNLVFKTSDVGDAVQRGWDGTRNGSRQPAGVYFWKVKGFLADGEKVLLNGKESGSIVLVR